MCTREADRTETPYERVRRRFFDALQESKSHMDYAVVKISDRRYMVVKYSGGAYNGDFEAQNGYFFHKFDPVENDSGKTSLSLQ